MDGEYAEGFNDEANKLLVNSWGKVVTSKELNDNDFRKALVNSVSDGSEKNTFDKICSFAEACAPKSFCKDMKKQCDETKTWIKANIK